MSARTDLPGPPDPRDLLALDGLLSDEELLLRDTVRRFVADRVLPDVGEWFEEGRFPRELVGELARLGLLGMHLEGYGCAGTSATAYGLACLELEAGDSGRPQLRVGAGVAGHVPDLALRLRGAEAASGCPGWRPARSSAASGSPSRTPARDPGAMRTRARRDGGDWILDGTKMWITNGGIADVAVVWARTDDGVCGFLVPTDTPGFTANDIHRKLSLRASVTSELVLDGRAGPRVAPPPGGVSRCAGRCRA